MWGGKSCRVRRTPPTICRRTSIGPPGATDPPRLSLQSRSPHIENRRPSPSAIASPGAEVCDPVRCTPRCEGFKCNRADEPTLSGRKPDGVNHIRTAARVAVLAVGRSAAVLYRGDLRRRGTASSSGRVLQPRKSGLSVLRVRFSGRNRADLNVVRSPTITSAEADPTNFRFKL